ncbi:hypothetical protein EDM53_05795 [Rickettsiales endosymbiont of Peranema trichophorum]|nr:hypothetical protein EDM53_05795 [Rickettsiales endosymbiont of Peranema trichophorum]
MANQYCIYVLNILCGSAVNTAGLIK